MTAGVLGMECSPCVFDADGDSIPGSRPGHAGRLPKASSRQLKAVRADPDPTAQWPMPKYLTESRRGILLTGDIATMQRLVDGGVVHNVNIGGIHSKPGRVQRLRYVFLSPDEESQLRALANNGVKVSAQDLPGARDVSLPDLLAGSEL